MKSTNHSHQIVFKTNHERIAKHEKCLISSFDGSVSPLKVISSDDAIAFHISWKTLEYFGEIRGKYLIQANCFRFPRSRRGRQWVFVIITAPTLPGEPRKGRPQTSPQANKFTFIVIIASSLALVQLSGSGMSVYQYS